MSIVTDNPSKICSLNLYSANYQPLVDITWDKNRLIYSEKHGYSHITKIVEQSPHIGFEKFFLIDELMAEDNYDWFFWSGSDTLITNLGIKLESFLDDDYHLIIAKDCGGINADVFFLRNSEEGRRFVKLVVNNFEKYKDHRNSKGDKWYEQQVIIDHQEEFKGITKILPQKAINAYNYPLYHRHSPETQRDVDGNWGQWERGDFLLHIPGCSLEDRLRVFPEYLREVVE